MSEQNNFFDESLEDILSELEAPAEEEPAAEYAEAPAEEFEEEPAAELEEEYTEELEEEPAAEFEEEYTEEAEFCDGDEYSGEAAPKRRRRWVLPAVLALVIGIGAACTVHAYREVRELASVAYSLMDEAALAAEQAKNSDFAAVERTLAAVDAELDGVDSALDKPLWKLAAKVPGPGGDLTRLRALFGIWDNAYQDIITPALSTLQAHPLPDPENPDLKALISDTDALEAYVQLALAVLPACERCMDDFCAIPELSIPQLEEKMVQLRTLAETLRPYLPLAEDMLTTAALPALDLIRQEPLDSLMSSDEAFDCIINVRLILGGLELAEELVPMAEDWLARLETMPQLPSEKLNTLVADSAAKVGSLFALYHRAEEYIPLAKAFLDKEEKQQYLLAIQNNAEIRATGGFPGNIGLLYLEDGKLYVSSILSVYDVLSRYIDFTDPEVALTETERQLFYLFPQAPRDAVINPHFPRVAEIWCKSPHEGLNESHGVISISPTLVQDFLAVMDESIALSDGTVLDGSNAVRYLQNELYIKYFNNWEQHSNKNNDECDALFAEAAKLVLEMVMTSLAPDKIEPLLDVLDKQIENRTMMFWLRDPEGQAVIEELGASGGLNSDPRNPQVGVYYSGTVSSKLGWYLNSYVEIGEGRRTGNCMTYPVTVTYENTLTWQEYSTTDAWVVGTALGSTNPYLFVFAPAGGTVSNFQTSSGIGFIPAEYQGLQVGYNTWADFPLEETLVITCDVTTAPGVTTPPTVSKTPTLQEYRLAS